MSTIAHDGIATRSEAHSITATDVGIFLVRLTLGVIFFAHGAQKVFGWFGGHPLAESAAGLGHMVPLPLAYVAIFAEFLGGLGLIFGVLARLSALGIAINMVVAIALVHAKNGLFMNWFGNQKGEGFEYHLLAIAMALLVLPAGPGRIALMDLEGRWLRK